MLLLERLRLVRSHHQHVQSCQHICPYPDPGSIIWGDKYSVASYNNVKGQYLLINVSTSGVTYSACTFPIRCPICMCSSWACVWLATWFSHSLLPRWLWPSRHRSQHHIVWFGMGKRLLLLCGTNLNQYEKEVKRYSIIRNRATVSTHTHNSHYDDRLQDQIIRCVTDL